mmetsp:Transcript_35825/g.56221  ORF Transcript_35825/g.56221 Transcript_35825/m.56221 type:complete len:287 (-) Transcript_35825:865-1725(-)
MTNDPAATCRFSKKIRRRVTFSFFIIIIIIIMDIQKAKSKRPNRSAATDHAQHFIISSFLYAIATAAVTFIVPRCRCKYVGRLRAVACHRYVWRVLALPGGPARGVEGVDEAGGARVEPPRLVLVHAEPGGQRPALPPAPALRRRGAAHLPVGGGDLVRVQHAPAGPVRAAGDLLHGEVRGRVILAGVAGDQQVGRWVPRAPRPEVGGRDAVGRAAAGVDDHLLLDLNLVGPQPIAPWSKRGQGQSLVEKLSCNNFDGIIIWINIYNLKHHIWASSYDCFFPRCTE